MNGKMLFLRCLSEKLGGGLGSIAIILLYSLSYINGVALLL